MYVCMYVLMYDYMYVCMYVRLSVCMYICMYVRAYPLDVCRRLSFKPITV